MALDKNALRMAAGILTKVEKATKPIIEAHPFIRGGRKAPMYASKIDKSVIKSHIDGVKKVIGHLEAAVHELKLIPKTNMGDIPHAIQMIEQIISHDDGESGLKALLDVYYEDHGDLVHEGKVAEECTDMPHGRNPDQSSPSAIADYVRYGDQAEEEEERQSITPKDLAGIPALMHHTYARLQSIADFINSDEPPSEIKSLRGAPDRIGGGDAPKITSLGGRAPDLVGAGDAPKITSLGREEQEYQEEVAGFSIGQYVEDEEGQRWVVLDADPSPVKSVKGKIYVKNKADNTTSYLDPATLKVVSESAGYYTPANALSFGEVDKPLNVAGTTPVDYAPGEDKNEIPHQHLDGDRETTEKVKVPAGVMKALKDGAKEFLEAADKVSGRDEETERLYRTSANAFEQLITYLSDPTIMHIKRAQVYLTSLMGPILHKVPEGVVKFLADGGERRSLTKYFYDVKAGKK